MLQMFREQRLVKLAVCVWFFCFMGLTLTQIPFGPVRIHAGNRNLCHSDFIRIQETLCTLVLRESRN